MNISKFSSEIDLKISHEEKFRDWEVSIEKIEKYMKFRLMFDKTILWIHFAGFIGKMLDACAWNCLHWRTILWH